MPFTAVVRDGHVKPPQELKEVFTKAGLDPTAAHRPVVCSCGSGMTACVVALALHLIGIKAAVYDGSWTEWAQRGGPILP